MAEPEGVHQGDPTSLASLLRLSRWTPVLTVPVTRKRFRALGQVLP